jgi:hypothetical protein
VYVPAPPASSVTVPAGQRPQEEECLANVHAKSRLILEPLRALRPEIKGQAGACPDRTRAIPCKPRAVTMIRNIRGMNPFTSGTSGRVYAGRSCNSLDWRGGPRSRERRFESCSGASCRTANSYAELIPDRPRLPGGVWNGDIPSEPWNAAGRGPGVDRCRI